MKKIIVSVINDLSTDQRVHRHCDTLVKKGYEVLLVGRQWRDSLPIEGRNYSTKRMRLLFNKGALFYAEYNIRLFFFLLFTKAHGYFSNDLDTLLPNFLCSIIKRKPLIYDSHEYFTEVPELQNRKFPRGVWIAIEKLIFPKLKNVITVNTSIANIYQSNYAVSMAVVRNVPLSRNIPKVSREELGIDPNKKVMILQGAGINKDRGVEELVEAMWYIHSNDILLIIVGTGDVMEKIDELVWRHALEKKVMLTGKLPMEDVVKYTSIADLGITLDKDTNLNYRYSLPNKLFDYIQCGLPVFATNLVEVKRIIDQYELGEVASHLEASYLAKKLEELMHDDEKLARYRANSVKASLELNWENEKVVLEQVIDNAYH